jgi:hypothetical protein
MRAYATFHGLLAKNDKIDARLIAACTAAREDEDIHDRLMSGWRQQRIFDGRYFRDCPK